MILTINGKTIDVGEADTRNSLTDINPNKFNPRYILIQTDGALDKDQQSKIADLGVQSLELVGWNAYLCHYEPDDVGPLQAMTYIKGVSIYDASFSISKALQSSINLGGDEKRIRVVLHPSNGKWEFSEAVEQLADVFRDNSVRKTFDLNAACGTVTMNAPVSRIPDLAQLDFVKVIEEVIPKVLYNDRVRDILGFSDWNTQVLNDPTFDFPFQGKGQVVAVADTGLDKGSSDDVHPAFTGRVKALIPLWQKTAEDFDGHGTHVAGSIAGAPVATSSPGFQHIRGTAPAAELVIQSIASSQGIKVPEGEDLKKFFLEPYQKYDAHVHCDSWGDSWTSGQIGYTSESKLVDQVIYENPDLLICVAAGNDGHRTELATIGSIAACKNVLTVGATESTRLSLQGKLLRSGTGENDPTQVSYFSGRGPTLNERIKPDVLALGTTILSTLSRLVRRAPSGELRHPELEKSDDPNYAYCSGTSMATPLVAGCAAALREYLVSTGIPKPPAALLKALLINGSFAMHHAHGGREGFGIVNIINSIVPPKGPGGGFLIGDPIDNINKGHDFKIMVQASPTPARPSINRVTPPSRGGITLKATLVYTDAPGEKLQNNLHIQVTVSDGRIRNGNRGSSKWYDNSNNVEQVIWKGIPPGEATITVLCTALTSRSQDYALVWRVIGSDE